MFTVTATEAGRSIRRLAALASDGHFTVVRSGKPVAVVLSPDEYARLTNQGQPRQGGFAKGMFTGMDINALLATPIDDVFS